MSLKDADGMANSVDPDQTASRKSLIWVYTVWPSLSVQKHRIITVNGPAHEIMVLFVLRKPILQTRKCSHPVGLDIWFLVRSFVYFDTSFVRTAKALARLRECTDLPEPSLVAYVISTIVLWAGSNINLSENQLLAASQNNIFGTWKIWKNWKPYSDFLTSTL